MHSAEIFPRGEDVNTVDSARIALTDARKLLHEIRNRMINNVQPEKSRGSGSWLSSRWHSTVKAAVSDKKLFRVASAPVVSKASASHQTSLEALASEEAAAMGSTEALAEPKQKNHLSQQVLREEADKESTPNLPPTEALVSKCQ